MDPDPVTHAQIPTIEDKLMFCLQLFPFCDDEAIRRTQVYISTKPYAKTIALLYCETGGMKGSNTDGHYALIKNCSPFMADIKAANGHSLHWCKKSLGHF